MILTSYCFWKPEILEPSSAGRLSLPMTTGSSHFSVPTCKQLIQCILDENILVLQQKEYNGDTLFLNSMSFLINEIFTSSHISSFFQQILNNVERIRGALAVKTVVSVDGLPFLQTAIQSLPEKYWLLA